MSDYRKERIERVRPLLMESYDFQIALLEQRAEDLRKETLRLKTRKAELIELRNNVYENLGRATDSDLAGVHFVFFGRETP